MRGSRTVSKQRRRELKLSMEAGERRYGKTLMQCEVWNIFRRERLGGRVGGGQRWNCRGGDGLNGEYDDLNECKQLMKCHCLDWGRRK